MKRVSTLQIIIVHLGLILVTAAVLYPVMWVIRIRSSLGASPVSSRVCCNTDSMVGLGSVLILWR